MTDIIVPRPEAYVWAIRQMHKRGEISLEQYAECLRRYSAITKK